MKIYENYFQDLYSKDFDEVPEHLWSDDQREAYYAELFEDNLNELDFDHE